eukprot:GFYU01003943.1.p1 GENE.GFYU01003943.1~~GFYU01003943.1.p1  ORF type:complete len:169 (-),score=19.14 GFYU01003943.1:448-903(-)
MDSGQRISNSTGPVNKVLSSLTLEIFIYFDRYYNYLFFLVNVAIFVWKGQRLPYPDNTLGWEIVILFLYTATNSARLFLGSMGNKTEETLPMAFFILLSLLSIVGNIYYLQLQTFVLRFDVLLNSIALFFIGVEIVLGIVTTIRFQTKKQF